MSRRLGEILVDAGRLSEAQLHRALTAQLVFGGHLGTSLLELGCIDEETLGETLASSFGVPYADFDILSKVPYSVIRALPAKLVEKHKVVPLRLEGRTLHLAMIDPKNLLSLDEISFVTGYRIVPWVSPEVRILQVLEKYYNLPRTQRYATLTRELSRLKSRREKLRPLQSDEVYIDPESRPENQVARAVAAAGAGGNAARRAAGADDPPSPFAPPLPAAGAPVMTASAIGHPRAGEPAPDHWEKYGYGRSWRELADELEAESDDAGARAEEGAGERSEEADTRPQPKTPLPAAAAREAGLAAPSLRESATRLAEAESVEEVVESTLSYLSGRLVRSVFFVLKGDRMVARSVQGFGLSPQRLNGLAFDPGGGPSLFDLAGPRGGEGASHYLGAVPPGPASRRYYEWLGVPPPRTMLLAPIVVKGRVTGYLYGDGGDRGMLAIDLPAVLSLCARAGFALQILILRNKILAA